MPASEPRQPNPETTDAWSKMSDSRDFFVILHNSVGAAKTTRIYETSAHFGTPVKARHTQVGDTLTAGAIVSAKTFGPGADIQRLIDLGAIREATKFEADAVTAELTGDGKPRDHAPDAAVKKDEHPAGPAKVEPAKAEPAKVVEPEKK